MRVKDYFNERLGYDYDFLGPVAVAHLGWVLIFLSLSMAWSLTSNGDKGTREIVEYSVLDY